MMKKNVKKIKIIETVNSIVDHERKINMFIKSLGLKRNPVLNHFVTKIENSEYVTKTTKEFDTSVYYTTIIEY